MKAVALGALTIACMLSLVLAQWGSGGYGYGRGGGSGGGSCEYNQSNTVKHLYKFWRVFLFHHRVSDGDMR